MGGLVGVERKVVPGYAIPASRRSDSPVSSVEVTTDLSPCC
jgi:hypothetical protein